MIKFYLITFFVSLATSLALTPLIKKVALRLEIVDKPGRRKVHRQNMPTMGGIAMCLAFFVGALLSFRIAPININEFFVNFIGLCIGSTIIVVVGIVDDIRGLNARFKFLIQIIAAVILIVCGFKVTHITIPFIGKVSVGTLGLFFTVLWIVGMTNAINLLDGLDGLAAGISAISSCFIFLAATSQNEYIIAFLAICLVGACIGFLPFNFYPAKIFMGNSGSMFLGFMLSAIAVASFQKSKTIITLFIPIIALSIPIIDTSLAIVRRIAKGRPIFKPDKEHIHHQLLFREDAQRKVVSSLCFVSICFGMIALSFQGIQGFYAVIALLLAVVVTFIWIRNSGFLHFKKIDKDER